MPPDIRTARAQDAGDVWPLARDFATSFEPRRDAFDDAFRALLGRKDTLIAVATSPGAPGGTAHDMCGYLLASTHLTFLANGPVCWVEEVMVAPGHRQSGVGRSLMTYAESWARSRGAAYVSLASRRAGGFYAALGYDESATFFRKAVPPQSSTDA